jgi:hypothetical protein
MLLRFFGLFIRFTMPKDRHVNVIPSRSLISFSVKVWRRRQQPMQSQKNMMLWASCQGGVARPVGREGMTSRDANVRR